MDVLIDMMRAGRRIVSVAQLIVNVRVVVHKPGQQRTGEHPEQAGKQPGKLFTRRGLRHQR